MLAVRLSSAGGNEWNSGAQSSAGVRQANKIIGDPRLLALLLSICVNQYVKRMGHEKWRNVVACAFAFPSSAF